MDTITYISRSESDTECFAARFAEQLQSGDFLAFYGELGSGKTAFVRGLARTLCPSARVASPTYTVVNEYDGALPIFHFDLYRLHDDDSLYATGYYDYFDRRGIFAVEWCENIPASLPPRYYKIEYEKCGEHDRKITISYIEE